MAKHHVPQRDRTLFILRPRHRRILVNLMLTRKQGQSIRIGHDITITLIRIGEGTAKLSVQAPKDVGVHRAEVYDRIYDTEETG